MQKIKSKFIVYILVAILFVGINTLSIAFLTVFTGSLLGEIFKWFQLLSIIFLCSSALNKWKKLTIFCSAFLFLSYYIAVLFFINTNINLDYYFLKRNIADIDSVIGPFIFPLILLLPISFFNSFLNTKIWQYSYKWRKTLAALSVVIILLPVFFSSLPMNELTAFIKTIYQRDRVINYFQKFQKNLINQSAKNKFSLLAEATEKDKEKIPRFLENVIILQIESLNNRLVNASTTPNFLNFAKQGVYFPKFYSNSVQTIFGQENLLCSLPSSFDMDLVQSGFDKKVACLPEIFNSLDYKTFFLKSYRLDFTRTGEFMKNIGFSEVHADDIMQADDPRYKWGYREDVFFNRALDFFQRNKQAKRNFLYLEIGPTNHWPFSVPDDFKGKVPYPEAKNHQERLANTTFIQDSYLPIALEKINQIFPEKNYTLFLLSDHTWPLGTHENNIFNQQGAFEDNFLSTMAVQIGNEEKYRNKIISTRYSLMDVMPSVLDLFGLSYRDNDYSRSFLPELNNEKIEENQTILIQPYSNKQIGIIQNNIKIKYQADSQNILNYDLSIDPEESTRKTISTNDKDNLIKIQSLLPLLDNEHVVMHALGGIDQNDYTNSREAFILHYQRGRRIFEIDFVLNKEKKLLAVHDIEDAESLSMDDFKNKKVLGKYSPLVLDDMLKLLKDYPEAKLIIDMKSDFIGSYLVFIQEALAYDPEILDRIIPQIYHGYELSELDKLYEFKNIIYTLYKDATSAKKIVEFGKANPRIQIITLSKGWFSKQLASSLHDIGKQVFVHTVNKVEEIDYCIDNGADGIYTDYY
jgi:glycerophosphoryl diester phosphodiesterase